MEAVREIFDEAKARRMTPQVLDRLHDDALRKIISDNLDRRTCASPLWDNLTSLAVVGRTIRILESMAESVDLDLARRDADYQSKAPTGDVEAVMEAGAAYLGWKTRTLSFRAMIAYRLSFATMAAARVVPDGEFAGQRGQAWETNHLLLARLAKAIQDHQNGLGDSFGDVDLDLYDLLDTEYVATADGQVTLREWAAKVAQIPGPAQLARAS